ncbi:MAG TPA: ectonucleotide pyrophosphatase/phosphodiesterase [Gemmatimonadales bacterium]
MVLVSLDGFRSDYLDRGLTPTLARLAAEGVRAGALVPVFPTKTFPNHYTIVTGLYPGRHGIVGNEFTAPELGSRFALHDRAAVRDPRFWGGEPIWVTAERQGLRTAPFFWPGSEAPIGGLRPTWWAPYAHELPDTARVRQVLDWLALPPDRRPAFVTLYFSLVDHAGHEFGPTAAETDSAIARADALLARLLQGQTRLAGDGAINLVIVSDHGMAATDPGRVVWLDDHVRRDWLEADALSPVLTAWPAPGKEDSVVRGLGTAAHLRVYRRSELPARYHLKESPRIAPVIAVADEGWSIAWRARPGEQARERPGGEHGYDNRLASMGALFVAHGPAFRRGVVVPPFQNVHLYPLLADLLGVDPAPSDGSADSLRAILALPAGSPH